MARLSTALQAATDTRPSRREELLRQRQDLTQRVRNLLTAIESGAGSTAILQLRAREAELGRVEADIATLDVPIDAKRLSVIPSWVKQQVADVVTVLQDRPDRVKAELSRLGVRFTLFPTYDVPQGQQPYLRAVGEGDFEALVGTNVPFPLTGHSLLRSTR